MNIIGSARGELENALFARRQAKHRYDLAVLRVDEANKKLLELWEKERLEKEFASEATD